MNKWIGVVAGKSGDTITDELHRRGFKVALVAGKDGEAGTDIADKVFICDLKEYFLIKNFFDEMKIKNILFATGHRLAIDLAEKFEKDKFEISLDLSKVRLCKNKYTFKKELRKIGIETPEDFLLYTDNFNDKSFEIIKNKIGYPCVLKSIEDVQPPEKIFNEDALKDKVKDLLQKEDCVFVEKFIHGADATVPVFIDDTEIKKIFVMSYSKAIDDKLKGFENSYILEFTEKQKNKILDYAKNIVDKFALKGLIRIDVVAENEKIFVLEVNCVIVSGNVGDQYNVLFLKSGFNRASCIVDYALKKFYKLKFERLEKHLYITKNSNFINKSFKDCIIDVCIFENNYKNMWNKVLKSNADFVCIKLKEFSNDEYIMLQNIAKDLNKRIVIED